METIAGSADTRSLGQVLAAERERQGLARTDIAQRLHMSAWQVEALEGGDFSKLPRGTFLRGFVRNYARVLHLDPNSVLPLLAESAPSEKAPGIIVPSEKIRFDPMGERLTNPYVKAAVLAFVALLLGFAALYWWFFIRPKPPAADVKKPVAAATSAQGGPQQVAVAPITPAETPPPTEAPRDTEPAPQAAPKVEAKAPAQQPSPRVEARAPSPQPSPRGEGAVTSVTPAAGEKRIAFRFAGESWVEIKDARGRTLTSKLHAAGTQVEYAGRPPFSVTVGNAPEVQMTFEDRPYDLQPHSRVGVARLTVQ